VQFTGIRYGRTSHFHEHVGREISAEINVGRYVLNVKSI